MCGIAGVMALGDPPRDGAREAANRMLEALRHRGPDGQGVWQSPDRAATFAHARLAIIELGHGGAQPMVSPDGRHALVFNGEIYNHGELRERLRREGESFASQSDSEVLLRLWSREGPACLRHLRGMYAFAVWDSARGEGWLARDGFGIKPLYYTASGGRLAFASELRALLAGGLVSPALDPDAVAGYFALGSVPEPRTLVAGVSMLPAGHLLHVRADGVHLQRHWHPVLQPRAMDRGEALARTRDALLASVRAHLVSDVPVALFLSAGLDSTALLGLAYAGGEAEALTTLSIGVDDAAMDESGAAAATARAFGVRNLRLQLDAGSARAAFPRYLEAIDQPSVDGFNTWMVSRLAREAGFKVALSGLGGDELFGGYPSFAAVPRLHRWASAVARVPGGAALAGRAAPLMRGPARRMAAALPHGTTLQDVHHAFRGIFAADHALRLAKHYTGARPARPSRTPLDLPGDDALAAVGLIETCTYMRNQLLRDSDAMSMAHALELRVPLVDSTLFDAVACVPTAWRLEAGKRLLLDTVPEIPAAIRGAPKRGFRFPFASWMADGLFAEAGADPARWPVRPDSWYQRWSLHVFEAWTQAMGLRR